MLAFSTLSVGPGREFASIEAAVDRAHPGDVVRIYPDPGGYAGCHIRVRVPHLIIEGVGTVPVLVTGRGFEYSGQGPVPRAIFEFAPGSDGGSVRNLELCDARNASGNGAGVRIDQAKGVTIQGCDIHDNDMGIMSNGQTGNEEAAADQLIDHCRIHENGSLKERGYSHNLYLGGASATVQFCDIFGATSGHNLKSRTHFILVQYCFIHAAANREVDIVESWDTQRSNSNAVLIGNVIAKAPQAENRNVVHFGEEHGVRNGNLYLINNSIWTPFSAPVVEFDSPETPSLVANNVIASSAPSRPALVSPTTGGDLIAEEWRLNWVSRNYDLRGVQATLTYRGEGASPFQSVDDFVVKPAIAALPMAIDRYLDGQGKSHPTKLSHRYVGQGRWKPSTDAFLGAG